jgi:uncharacterized membrane protein YhaH (DUF805 family)
VEGNGSREFPFVIQTSNTLRSAQVQREILDGIYGQGTKESADRFYYESHRGIHGNSDLCEHRFIIKGENKSIWFDLYLVTRLASDPEWNLKKNEIVSKALENPETVRILDKMFQKIGLPAQPTVAASTSGSPPGHSSPAVDTLKIANIPPVLRRPVSKQIHPVLAYFIPIGRLNRAMWFACNLLNLCALGAIEYLAELFIDSKGVPPQWLLVSVGCLCIYLISVTAAKRLHDLNASAWLFFLVFIPLVPLFLLVLSGTKGPNKYGPEP